MDTVMEPDAQIFWQSSGTVSDAAGTRDLTPTTDAGWAAAESAAATVAETGNLLMTPIYGEDRGSDWIAFAQDLVRAGEAAEKAAMDRDGDAMFEAGGTLSDACSACHQAYLPQEEAARADSAR
jgi:cytochrome c556